MKQKINDAELLKLVESLRRMLLTEIRWIENLPPEAVGTGVYRDQLQNQRRAKLQFVRAADAVLGYDSDRRKLRKGVPRRMF